MGNPDLYKETITRSLKKGRLSRVKGIVLGNPDLYKEIIIRSLNTVGYSGLRCCNGEPSLRNL